MIEQLLPGIGFIAFGIYLAAFRTQLGRLAVEWNHRLLGIHPEVRAYEISFLVVGIIFGTLGALTLVGILDFR